MLFGSLQEDNPQAKVNWYQFFAKRFIRIWPLYFLSTMLAILCIPIVSSNWFNPNPDLAFAFSPLRYDANMIIRSLTFTRFPELPALAVGWSLQLEFVFYSTISILLACRMHSRNTLTLAYALITLLSIAFLNSALSGYATVFPPVKITGFPIMLEFVLGMLLYLITAKGYYLNRQCAGVLLILGVPAVLAIETHSDLHNLAGEYHRTLIWGLIAFLIVWSALTLENRFTPAAIFITLGNASYSLYLTHWIVLPWYTHVIDTQQLYEKLGIAGVVLSFFAISQAIAVAVHYYVEIPITNALKLLTTVKPKATPKTLPPKS